MSDADPRVVWDALARLDYGPHGPVDNFRSRCPGHDGDNPTSLSVRLQPSGIITAYCHAYGCAPEEIVERIGLRMADLFPSDRVYTGRGLRNARREDFTGDYRTAVNTLLAAQVLGNAVRVEIKFVECPCCESPHASVVVPASGEPFTHCWRECGVEAMTGGLAERIREGRRWP